ncbi:hypothetical protein B0T21DRAFT_352436 [Apiosordaria backusii]|uniref:Uncharacterized protein n=1 Tax=Apiosordaria backusii TaxID=314023 RepID=A0AA40AAF3_9PEZI|nr:hypothetical protein B0T21DRAFT_352436 [Apiosordaria backusii]
MLLTILLLFPILGWAADLVFHPAGNCWEVDDNPMTISCRNIPQKTCCFVSAPYCGVLNCVDCPIDAVVYSYFHHNCSVKADNWCKITHFAASKKGGCCVDLGLQDVCAGSWTGAFATAVSLASEKLCVEPNAMAYVDHHDGVKREIYIPQGELDRATKLWLAGDFEGLGKFEDWAGQSAYV